MTIATLYGKTMCGDCQDIADMLTAAGYRVIKLDADETFQQWASYWSTLSDSEQDLIVSIRATLALQCEEYPVVVIGDKVYGKDAVRAKIEAKETGHD